MLEWGPLVKCRLSPMGTHCGVGGVLAVAVNKHEHPKQHSCDGVRCPSRLIYFAEG